MGRVFQFQDIQEGRAPRLQDYGAVAESTLKALSDCQYVIGATFFGSFAHGTYSIRSDINCLLIYKNGHDMTVDCLLQGLVESAHDLHIPLSFTKQSDVVARVQFRHVGDLFLQHFSSNNFGSNAVKKKPESLFGGDYGDKEEVTGYLRNKIMMFENVLPKGSVLEPYQFHRLLEDVLGTPFHVARKILYFLNKHPYIDTKAEVVKSYSIIFHKNIAMTNTLRSIARLDREYDSCLNRQLINPNSCSYEYMLGRILAEVYEVKRFVTSNALWLEQYN